MATDLSRLIATLVEERIEGVRLVDVSVEEAADQDGDDILKVTVVFEKPKAGLDFSRVRGLVRTVRPALEKIGETRFPIFSFVADNERRFAAGAS